jgi:4-hydroxy-3-methylbut-2-enyl diphosphate reductase
MKIILAKNIGFCPGVKRAVKIAKGAIKKYGPPIFMFGPLVHNEEVTKSFKESGALEVSSIKSVPLGSRLIISAHGIGPISRKEIINKKIKIIDTTCPWVKRTHNFVKNNYLKGCEIILLGEKKHREVEGIKEWGSKVWIVSSLKEAEKTLKKIKSKKIAFVSQTTQKKKLFDEIVRLFRKKSPGIIIFDTICRMTLLRQKEIKGLTEKSDIMVVVGSKNSANSRRLYEISKKINKKTYFVSSLRDLRKEWFGSAKKIGISSGASAPPEFVQKIRKRIESL